MVADGARKSRAWVRLPIAEIAATVILGSIGLVVDKKVGVFVWAVGILLAMNAVRSDYKADARAEKVVRLADLYDLSQTCDVDDLRNVIDAFGRIPEPEFAQLKTHVVAEARDELLRLATDKSSGVLPPSQYYAWLLPMLDGASSTTKIRALSMMMTCEWDDSNPEKRFKEATEDAADRGVETHRIFVVPRQELAVLMGNAAVAAHADGSGPKDLHGYVVIREELERSDPSLLEELGEGFIAFDERVALVDSHTLDGKARGEVTMLPAKLASLVDTHDRLRLHAEPLTQSKHGAGLPALTA